VKRRAELVLLAAVLVGVLLGSSHMASADHVDFRFKWPWRPLETTTVDVTGWPYQAHHCCGETCNDGGPGSCTDAYDFVISDDWVISSAEGAVIVAERVDDIDPQWCRPSDHLGNVLKVQVATPTASDPASSIRVFYGHLSSLGDAAYESTILQGDYVGVQGLTGYTLGDDYGWNGTSWGKHCGKHLHFEFWPSSPSDPQHPDKIDGQTSPGTSTNSGIGEYWYYGFPPNPLPIRTKYIQMGGWDGIDPSYSATIDDMGWTNDPQRAGLPMPAALYVHTYRTWGYEQNFRQPPDPWGKEREGIYQSDWVPGSGFVVRSPFWDAWEAGALVPNTDPPQYKSISVPLADQGGCPSGSRPDCAAYQLTHLGYLWMYTLGWYAAVWCPDVAGTAYEHTKSGGVAMNDVLAVLAYVGCYQGGPPHNGFYYDAWFDADGSAAITMSDVLAVLAAAGRLCKPT
jgi:hypothetical protein